MTDHAELIERLRNSRYRFATETQNEAAIRRNKAAADAASFIAALVAERDRYRALVQRIAEIPSPRKREESDIDALYVNEEHFAAVIDAARAALAQGGEKP